MHKAVRIMAMLTAYATIPTAVAAPGGAVQPPPEAPQIVVVKPQDTGEALVNPDMGWTLHFYSNLIENYGSKLEPSDTLDDWPGLSTIYLRVPWSFVEPKEGQFNWSLFDTPSQRWIAKGKRIAMRVSCCESWWRYATPRWVQEAGAKGCDFEFGKGPRPGGPLWEPDYLDPVFQEFWPRTPVVLEHEHYGASKARQAWSGDLLLKSVEDYHASYLSIHWWPREELSENRRTVVRINRRLGYRVQLREIRWPSVIVPGVPFTVETAWANAGVAPCYPGSFWSLTLKDQKGGIAAVVVDEAFDVRRLQVGPPGQPPLESRRSRFTVAMPHVGPQGVHAPPLKPGGYGVFVSVGSRDGTPRIALPLGGDDGQHRYRLGAITVQPAPRQVACAADPPSGRGPSLILRDRNE